MINISYDFLSRIDLNSIQKVQRNHRSSQAFPETLHLQCPSVGT